MFLRKIVNVSKVFSYFQSEFDKSKILSAKALVFDIQRNAGKLESIQDAEFSVFSQWGDDGIIQYLINTLHIDNKTFIEFGVENYTESNTRFLLINNNWKGLVMDGSPKNIDFIRNDNISWKYNIEAVCAFITKDNVNSLIKNAGFQGEIGLLHIDIDGNDYWFWECLDVVNPAIVILEYNSAFGNKSAITVPYKSDFIFTKEHHSNLFYGASLKAFAVLAAQKGYALVGSNSNGNNVYFVRKDKLKGLKELTPEQAYVKAAFRQNRDKEGNLTLKSDHEMIKMCGDKMVFDVEQNELVTLKSVL